MGILSKITSEYFGDIIRKEAGKIIEIDGCKVLVPADYDEYDFLYKIDEILDSMFITITKEKGDYDYCFSFKCGKGKWWMNIESYDYFQENTTHIDDFDKNMYDSLVKFLEYFLKDVNIVKNDDYTERMELLDEDKYEKIKGFFAKEGIPGKADYYFVEMIYDFYECFGVMCSFSRDNIAWHSGEDDKTIYLDMRNQFSKLNTYRIRWIKDLKKWWDEKFEKIEKEGVRNHFIIK